MHVQQLWVTLWTDQSVTIVGKAKALQRNESGARLRESMGGNGDDDRKGREENWHRRLRAQSVFSFAFRSGRAPARAISFHGHDLCHLFDHSARVMIIRATTSSHSISNPSSMKSLPTVLFRNGRCTGRSSRAS